MSEQLLPPEVLLEEDDELLELEELLLEDELELLLLLDEELELLLVELEDEGPLLQSCCRIAVFGASKGCQVPQPPVLDEGS